MPSDNPLEIYLELGNKKIFAYALDWPGWCRSGKDEAAAIETLIAYAPRYADILQGTDIPFVVPPQTSNIAILERVEGDFSTSYGVPVKTIQRDAIPMSERQISRFTIILQAAWQAFDRTVKLAEGKPLRKGPRGGGRELAQIREHVILAENGYLRHLGNLRGSIDDTPDDQRPETIRTAVLNAIREAAEGRSVQVGPRGAKQWPLAYFFRRITWHVVDHTWEIEDRVMQ